MWFLRAICNIPPDRLSKLTQLSLRHRFNSGWCVFVLTPWAFAQHLLWEAGGRGTVSPDPARSQPLPHLLHGISFLGSRACWGSGCLSVCLSISLSGSAEGVALSLSFLLLVFCSWRQLTKPDSVTVPNPVECRGTGFEVWLLAPFPHLFSSRELEGPTETLLDRFEKSVPQAFLYVPRFPEHARGTQRACS